jgi:transcriptional regulator with XRE-family HTH domain
MKSLLEIASTLRARARQMQITQAALALAAGVSRRTLTHALDGEHDIKVTTLIAVADRLGLELVLLPKGAVRAAPGIEALNDAQPAVKTRVQEILERTEGLKRGR